MASRNTQTIVVYTAAGTLAAGIVAYVLGPTLFQVDDKPIFLQSNGTVGLSNPGADCFINSGLQALAGLPSLQRYLLSLSPHLEDGEGGQDEHAREKKSQSAHLSRALLALQQILIKKPPARKTASAKGFIRSLEYVLQTRIGRQQQDAHEFLHVVLDQLFEEQQSEQKLRAADSDLLSREQISDSPSTNETSLPFPFKGSLDTIIQCTKCQSKPKPTISPFLVLTLNVPQVSSTSLDECLDGLLKVETIDDYKCQNCCAQAVLDRKLRQKGRHIAHDRAHEHDTAIIRLQEAIESSFEEAHGVDDIVSQEKDLPTNRITKYSVIADHPDVLAFHLSRSIYDLGSSSRKNNAILSFPEELRMGGFNKEVYRLMCLITHKGGHDSGHYETFRRQSSEASLDQSRPTKTRSVADDAPTNRVPSDDHSGPTSQKRKKASKRLASKWWRISDDSVASCATSDVLAMNKEAYLLFYEIKHGAQ